MTSPSDADAALRRLAAASGVSPSWTDHAGRERPVAHEDLQRILHALGVACESGAEIAASLAHATRRNGARALPAMILADIGERALAPADEIEARHGVIVLEGGEERPVTLHEHADGFLRFDPPPVPGYHRLRVGAADIALTVAPRRCFTAADASNGAPAWALAAQLYSLRTAGDGGVGGHAGAEALCVAAGHAGADALALSPTHALFLADPDHASPYSPSTRLFRNPVHADLASVLGPARVAAAMARAGVAEEMARLEALELVDWRGACLARRATLEALFDDFLRTDAPAGTPLGRAFEAFCADGGEALRDHARFEVLHAHYFGSDFTKWNWRTWAPEHRGAGSADVERFALAHRRAVQFHMFAQWIADASQARVQAAAREAGMRIGLIGDLAIGVNPGGSHAWSRPDDLLDGLTIGAPPDPLAPRGQNWGLTTFAPSALRAQGYAPFIATLRAMLRHTGGVRIDHVMGLARLWLAPPGEDASHGAYLAYPFADLMRLVRLESQRHRAIVIGEDLGTAPHGFRERLHEAGVYGMRVVPFERDHDVFRGPERYAFDAAAMTSTHDIATVAGWWSGHDLEVRESLGQFGPGQTLAGERAARAQDRARLWSAFAQAGAASGEAPPPEETEAAGDAAVAFLARTGAQLALIPLEDVVGAVEQPNLPGTTTEHPNWRRRHSADARRLLDGPTARRRVRLLSAARPRDNHNS